jgi:DNA-directed RNA polymerase subunit RPC12/RpoP
MNNKQICPTLNCNTRIKDFKIGAMFAGTQVPSAIQCPKCKQKFRIILKEEASK